MPAFFDVWYIHDGEEIHSTFLGRPRPVADETTGKITGYTGKSAFGEPKRVVAIAPYPEFHAKPIRGASPAFRKGQKLRLANSLTIERVVSDVTWRLGAWHYYVMPVAPSSKSESRWIVEIELRSSKLVG